MTLMNENNLIKGTWMHFIVKYASRIGNPCNDGIFQTKKDNMTATRVINTCIERYFKSRMRDAYIKEDSEKIVEILDEIISIYDYLGINPDADWLDDHILPFSIGNDKIGNDTLCISINTAVLCYMGITGRCDNCDICYAVASNKMYTSEFLKNNISQKHFIESDAESIGFSTLEKILTKLTKKELSKLRFIRFNVNGDILNNEQLKKLNRIAEILMDGLKIKISYTYTHNTGLDFSIAGNILINPSFYHDTKCCLTVDDFDASMMDDDSMVICNGHCYRCSYCKNPKERRTVIFLAHGGGKKGVKAIPNDLMRILEERKESDYLKFIEDYGI